MKKLNVTLGLLGLSCMVMAQTTQLSTKIVKAPSQKQLPQKQSAQTYDLTKIKTTVVQDFAKKKSQDKIFFVPDEKKSKAMLRNFGGQEGNGGDMCESRIKDIRDDIETWIKGNGWKALNLSSEQFAAEYPQRMLEKLQAGKISCTDDKIMVREKEKTCVNYENQSGQLEVVCNIERFMVNTQEADQYPLIHHEFAVPAGFETSADRTSQYKVSNQLTGFLENQVVKKLAIKPARLDEVTTKRSDGLETGTYKLIPTELNTEYCDQNQPKNCYPTPEFAQIVAVTFAGEPDYARFVREKLFRVVLHLKNGEQKELDFKQDEIHQLEFTAFDKNENYYWLRVVPEESSDPTLKPIKSGNCFFSPWLKLGIKENGKIIPTYKEVKSINLNYGLRAFCK